MDRITFSCLVLLASATLIAMAPVNQDDAKITQDDSSWLGSVFESMRSEADIKGRRIKRDIGGAENIEDDGNADYDRFRYPSIDGEPTASGSEATMPTETEPPVDYVGSEPDFNTEQEQPQDAIPDSAVMSWAPCSDIPNDRNAQEKQCLNGGTCVNEESNVACRCAPTFWGPRCEFGGTTLQESQKDPCESNPCKNEATCKPQIEANNKFDERSFTCFCPEGYGGIICDVPSLSSRCTSNYCSGHGNATLKGTSDKFVGDCMCDCDDGWAGPRCDIACPCLLKPDMCKNGGECIDIRAGNSLPDTVNETFCGFKCICPTDEDAENDKDKQLYNDTFCEFLLPGKQPKICQEYPCFNRGKCVPKVAQAEKKKKIPRFKSKNKPLGRQILAGLFSIGKKAIFGSKDDAGRRTTEKPLSEIERSMLRKAKRDCVCQPPYFGQDCEKDERTWDPCQDLTVEQLRCMMEKDCAEELLTNPNVKNFTKCQNGGNCFKNPKQPRTFQCSCPLSHFGPVCEDDNPCFTADDKPKCEEGSDCVPLPFKLNQFFSDFQPYTCLCLPGQKGENCHWDEGEENVNRCRPNPCHHGGSCVPCRAQLRIRKRNSTSTDPEYDVVGNDALPEICSTPQERARGFICSCRGGWTGIYCSGENPCDEATNGCQNNAVCVEDPKELLKYRCDCQDGFNGTFCEDIYNICKARSPCVHGTCKLILRDPGYVCKCDYGLYEGRDCQLPISRGLWNIKGLGHPHVQLAVICTVIAVPLIIIIIVANILQANAIAKQRREFRNNRRDGVDDDEDQPLVDGQA